MNQPNEDRLTPEHRKSVNGAKAFLGEHSDKDWPLKRLLETLIQICDKLAPEPLKLEA